ncbi:leucyl/phenylalanyl-tRNA--protein transferase [bacterium]|nr:leucyl/phenylalanyl-tRNA--protein transferase [bacterium]
MKGSENTACRSFFPSPFDLIDHPDPDGVVALDGKLDTRTLIEAYRLGVFPWPTEIQLRPRGPAVMVLLWFCPPERAILEYRHLHIGKSLEKSRRRELNAGHLRITENQSFREVMEACASTPRPGSTGTWITSEMIQAYTELFDLGYARSVEVWDSQGYLVGGIYGVEVDGIFSAESMFHRVPNASKIALLHLMESLHSRGISWIDIQMMTPHLERLGARALSRREFLGLLQRTQKR